VPNGKKILVEFGMAISSAFSHITPKSLSSPPPISVCVQQWRCALQTIMQSSTISAMEDRQSPEIQEEKGGGYSVFAWLLPRYLL